jgi:hypothetical protein
MQQKQSHFVLQVNIKIFVSLFNITYPKIINHPQQLTLVRFVVKLIFFVHQH